jgi:hypothetical protein
MREVTIHGVTYVAAADLAKKYRYTSDYIGQLCRSKKIDAELVGRTWYVNPVSLEQHRSGRYTKSQSSEKTIEINTESELSRIDVEPVVTRTTAKMAGASSKNFASRIEWKPVKYDTDDADLIPQIHHELPRKKVEVDLAESTKVKIKSGPKLTAMEPDELPEVVLRGKISIASLEEEIEEVEKSLDLLDIPAEEVHSVSHRHQDKPEERRSVSHQPLRPVSRSYRSLPSESGSREASRDVSVPSLRVSEVAVVADESGDGYIVITRSLVFATGVLALLIVMVVFLESQLQADAFSYSSKFDFSTQSLTALLGLFE